MATISSEFGTSSRSIEITRIIDGQCTFGKCNYLSWLYYSPPDFEVDGEVYTILQDDKVYRVSIKVIKIVSTRRDVIDGYSK